MKTDQLKARLRYLLATIVAGLLAACSAEQEVEEATQAATADIYQTLLSFIPRGSSISFNLFLSSLLSRLVLRWNIPLTRPAS